MTKSVKEYMNEVAGIGCVMCHHLDLGYSPAVQWFERVAVGTVFTVVVHSFTPQTHLRILSTAKKMFSTEDRVGLYPNAYAAVFTE